MDCRIVEERLALYLYEELGAEERAALEAHLDACPRCAAAAAELTRLRALLDQRPAREASPELLVHCRQDLEEALDREASSWRGLLRSWFVVPPGVSALRLTTALGILVLGFSLGWTLQRRTAAPGAASQPPSASWLSADLGDFRVSGISQVAPDPQTGAVRITLDAQRRVTLEGSLDDPRIRDLLVQAVKGYDNPGIRRDTLEVLRAGSENPAVREALLYALRKDTNPGVRLEALEAARGIRCDADLHAALLETVEEDSNAGVRVAATNLLIQHATEEHDPALLAALNKLAAAAPNPYVRLKCAQAVRELERDEF